MNTAFNDLVANAIAAGAVVEFNSAWKNGTGYLDGAVQGPSALKLHAGDCVTCVDDYGRKIVIIGAGAGKNAVIFQRFTGCGNAGVIVGNLPLRISNFLNEKALDEGNEKAMVSSRILNEGVEALVDLLAHFGVTYPDHEELYN